MEMLEIINPIEKKPFTIDTAIDTDWVNAFNRTLGEQTLSWARDVTPPKIRKSGFEAFYKFSDVENDALNVPPLNWGFTLKEPQTTGALVKFMSHSKPLVRFNRVVSFLSALRCDTVMPKENENISIFSEYPKGDGRIDILIAWGKGVDEAKFKHTVIVEVKQGAVLSSDQLQKYEAAAPTIAETCQFAFLFQSFSTDDMKQISASSQEWICSQWWSFLRRIEINIQADADDFEFRQFRSTLWEQLA